MSMIKNAKRANRSDAPRCSDEFRRGAECAADIARSYNRCTIHPYDLGDCILSKLNFLPKKRIRPNAPRDLRGDSRVTVHEDVRQGGDK